MDRFFARASKTTLALLALLGLTASLAAQAPSLMNFGAISAANGLPRQSVRAIAQSPEGILWLGLENSGLCRYDGHTFEVINESSPEGSQLSDDHVEAICPDNERGIWIGTARGLNRLDRDTGLVTWFRHDPSDASALLHDRIWALEMDRAGRLWVGTDGGLCYLARDRSGFVSIPPPAGREPAPVRDVHIDRNGRIWAMTTAGVYGVDPDTLAAALLPYEANQLEPQSTYCGTEDLSGRLWFSTAAGHIVFDAKAGSIRHIPILNADGSPRLGGGAAATTDLHGRVWFGTFAEGLFIIDPDTGEQWIREEPLVADGVGQPLSVRAMMRDRDGRIWAGTKFHGLVFYHPKMETFEHWPSKMFSADEQSAAAPLCVTVDESGAIWVGTHRQGITRIDPVTGARTHFQSSPHDDRAQCLEILPNGKALFGGINGIASLDTATGERQFAAIGSVMDILAMPDGAIWLGANTGLYTLDPDTFETARVTTGDPATDAQLAEMEGKALHLDPEGHVWIATRLESVYRLDRADGSLRKLESLAANDAGPVREGRAFLSDTRGFLWIAAKATGLARFDPVSRELKLYATEAGFASKAAYGALEDGRGALWISSDQGVCRFDPETEEVACFGTQHGLQAAVFEPNAQAKGPNGWLYFAGHNGLNAFQPSSITTPGVGSDLIFTELRIGNEIRVRDQATLPELRLEHHENQIMISFSLLDYGNHGRNQYAYRMSGVSEGWVDIGTRQTVSFNYLPPGSYFFEARARTPGANWSSNSPTATLQMTIAAPFWQTTSFRIALASIVLVLLVAIYLSLYVRSQFLRRRLERVVEERTRELKDANRQLTIQKGEVETSRQIIARSRDELEDLVNERTRELELAKNRAEESDRLKSAFLANMSHEIRTPMNAIIGFSSMIGLERTTDQERQEYTKVISSNCASLLRLIDDILDLSAIEAGQLRTAPRPFDLKALMRELNETFAAQIADKDPSRFQLLFSGPGASSPIVVSDPLRLRQILANLVNNALKFTRQGHVAVDCAIDEQRGHVRFAVEDTGIGIGQQHLAVIWDRFRKIEEDSETLFRGTGLGLSITKNLVELLGGEIAVASQEGKGSRFTFSIPLVRPAMEDRLESGATRSHEPSSNRRQATLPSRSRNELPTVLVAEDEDSNFYFLSRQIPSDRARVVRAFNGQEAIEMCEQAPSSIGLIFMDIKMPVLDGKQAARQIKRFAPHIPIVANTAYASKTDRDEIMARDFDGYMSKPTSLEEIASVLDRFLDDRS